jgi:integrase/recombinase XerD
MLLDTFFKWPTTVERLRGEVVGEHLDSFLAYMAEAGFAPLTLRQYLGGAIHFGRWARQVGLALRRVEADDVERFRRHLRRCRCRNGYRSLRCRRTNGAIAAAKWFVAYLRHVGIAPPLPVVVLPKLVGKFEAWMKEQRGSADRTLSDYRRHLLPFVETMRIGRRIRLDAAALRAYVITRSQRTTRTQMLVVVRALRMFVRFLVSTGRCPSHLDRAVPSVPHWKLSTLPRYLASSEIERVLAQCDPSTPLGVRDRAVLLLLARLGLRAGDVRRLQKTDLDWTAGRIRVVGKLRRPVWLPLPQEVGEAILEYLSTGRPACSVPEVFVCAKAPRRPLGATSVGEIAGRAIERAGVVSPSKGAHVFRHSAATTLVRAGATLDEIGVLLRHGSRDSTAIYAKVDLPALHLIAQPWPEPAP